MVRNTQNAGKYIENVKTVKTYCKYTSEPHTIAPQENGCKEGKVEKMTHEKEGNIRENTGHKVPAFLKVCCSFLIVVLTSFIGGEQQQNTAQRKHLN